jgi:hypothetical protein
MDYREALELMTEEELYVIFDDDTYSLVTDIKSLEYYHELGYKLVQKSNYYELKYKQHESTKER